MILRKYSLYLPPVQNYYRIKYDIYLRKTDTDIEIPQCARSCHVCYRRSALISNENVTDSNERF